MKSIWVDELLGQKPQQFSYFRKDLLRIYTWEAPSFDKMIKSFFLSINFQEPKFHTNAETLGGLFILPWNLDIVNIEGSLFWHPSLPTLKEITPEFPCGSAGWRSGTVTAVALVAAVVQVWTSACHRCNTPPPAPKNGSAKKTTPPKKKRERERTPLYCFIPFSGKCIHFSF